MTAIVSVVGHLLQIFDDALIPLDDDVDADMGGRDDHSTGVGTSASKPSVSPSGCA